MNKYRYLIGMIAVVSTALASLCSCGESKLEREQRERIDSLQNVNIQTRMDYDNLNEYLTTISDGLDSISFEENEIVLNMSENRGINRQRMKQQLDHIRETLNRHRERIAELEQKLATTQGAEKKLHTIIVALQKQIEQKDAELASLRRDLDNSRKSITELQNTVAQMNEIQENQQQKINEQETIIANSQQQLSKAYVKIDTKNNLKNSGILQGGGFLKKSKIDYSEFDTSLFTQIDINTSTKFKLPKKFKILTPVPDGSYMIQKNGDENTIIITNPDSFWSISKFLVIQIN